MKGERKNDFVSPIYSVPVACRSFCIFFREVGFRTDKESGHVRVIDTSWFDYSDGTVYINGTVEKIMSSGIYNKAYFSPAIPSHTVEIYRKL